MINLFNHENRKGELTTQQLVTIIVLITSFVVILFLIFRLNLGDTTDSEICHNSVVLRAKAGVFSGPLDCKTSYLCVNSGGECEGITASVEEKVDEGNKTQIFKTLAEEMASCWWQFGEGKIDYVDTALTDTLSCSVCSITDFSDELKDTQITYREFYEYLQKTPMNEGTSKTYLDYLYSTSNVDVAAGSFTTLPNYLSQPFDLDKSYFVLTGMASPGFIFSTRTDSWFSTKGIPHPVIILEKTQENYDKVGCDEFLTKA